MSLGLSTNTRFAGHLASRPARDASPARISYFALAIIVIAAAIGSIFVQGFEYGSGNNFFHIPIVLRLYDLTQFSDDGFLQSLRHFTSFIYFMMAQVATPANAKYLFLVAHFLTRAITFLALSSIAWSLGVRD